MRWMSILNTKIGIQVVIGISGIHLEKCQLQ